MGLEVGKILCAKLKISSNMRPRYVAKCSYYLNSPGHVDEQLKEWLKSKKKIGNCLLKIV